MFFKGGRCAWIHLCHPPQPRFNLGCGWEPGMRSLTNAPIVVAGVVVGGPLAGRANGPVARVGDTASPEWQSCVEVSPPRRRVFARGPVRLSTDQARHPRFASRTDFAGQSGGFVCEGGSRVGGCCLPQGARAFALGLGLGLAVWRDSLRRTRPWRRRALQWRRRSRQQPTAARNSVAPDGIVTSCSRLGSVLRF